VVKKRMTNSGNLVPDLDAMEWYAWFPRQLSAPILERKKTEGGTFLKIASDGKFENHGKWICRVNRIEGGMSCRFEVPYRAERVENETLSISVILTWMDANGKALARDYVDGLYSEKGSNWKKLYRTMETPLQAAQVDVELVLKWTQEGIVYWSQPVLEKITPIAHRKVRVATTYIKPRCNLDANKAAILNILEKAGEERPDIICLSESVHVRGVNKPAEELSEMIPGELTQAVAEKAKMYSTYVICNLNERDGDNIYNSCVLIDRKGEIAGKYRKVQLPLVEAEAGFTPGIELPVFETDFGKIGMMICWDQWFPEVARILRLKGAEMLFLPTIGYAPVQTLARALDNGIHVVVSGGDGPNPSRIINPEAQIIAEINNEKDDIIIAEVDLDKRYYQHWLSVGDANGEGASIYLKERRSDLYGWLANGE
jgi:predicted amidohydrolase